MDPGHVFYATAAGVIPVILLALAFQVRFTNRLLPRRLEGQIEDRSREIEKVGAEIEALDANLRERRAWLANERRKAERLRQVAQAARDAGLAAEVAGSEYLLRWLHLRQQRFQTDLTVDRLMQDGLNAQVALLRRQTAKDKRRLRWQNRLVRIDATVVVAAATVGEYAALRALDHPRPAGYWRYPTWAGVVLPFLSLVGAILVEVWTGEGPDSGEQPKAAAEEGAP